MIPGLMCPGESIFMVFENTPQTELAMRGSYGVAFRRGYDSSVDPVALPRSILYCNLHDLVTPTLKNTS